MPMCALNRNKAAIKSPRTENEREGASVDLVTWTRYLDTVIEGSWVIKSLFDFKGSISVLLAGCIKFHTFNAACLLYIDWQLDKLNDHLGNKSLDSLESLD